jgi:predicted MFS family arabinose efflux permease
LYRSPFGSASPRRRLDDVALPFLGIQAFSTGESGVGLLYAGVGVGLLLGFTLITRRPRADARVAFGGFALAAAGNLLTGIDPALAIAIAMQAVRGFGSAWGDVGVNSIVQREVPREVRGRAFANLYGGVGVAAGLSYLAGGALIDATGPRWVLAGGGGTALVCAGVASMILRRMRGHAGDPADSTSR